MNPLPDIEAALDDLAVDAPSSLADRTLVAVGLADAYAPIETAIGPIWVAFNGLGVSAVESAPSAEAFETRLLAEHARHAHRLDQLPPRLASAIQRRLAGDRRVTIPLDLRGHSRFEQDVWRKALEIPAAKSAPESAIHAFWPCSSPKPWHPEVVEITARSIAIASSTFRFVPADTSVGARTRFAST